MNTRNRFLDYVSEARSASSSLLTDSFLTNFEKVCDLLAEVIKRGGRIFVAGNGGSHSDSLHIAGELVNYFTKSHKAWPVMALGANGSVLTAWANDHNFADQFVRELSAFAMKGDVFLGITTSGKSSNILKCFAFAHQNGISSICLTGNTFDKRLLEEVDYVLSIDSSSTPHIQESHIIVYHALCKELEFRLSE